MKRSENTAIVLLMTTAAILAAVIIGGFVNAPEQAFADASTRDGDYTIATGAYDNDTDLLYVIDMAAQKLNVYVVNTQTKAIELRDKVNLRQAFR